MGLCSEFLTKISSNMWSVRKKLLRIIMIQVAQKWKNGDRLASIASKHLTTHRSLMNTSRPRTHPEIIVLTKFNHRRIIISKLNKCKSTNLSNNQQSILKQNCQNSKMHQIDWDCLTIDKTISMKFFLQGVYKDLPKVQGIFRNL